MDTFQVNVAINQITQNELTAGGYSLYVFNAVQCSDLAGQPAVLQRIQSFGTTTVVAVPDQYVAFTSTQTQASPGNLVTATFSKTINEGETLQVNEPGLTGAVLEEGTSGVITILNQTNQQGLCGIGQFEGSVVVPICVFPLYGNGAELIAPTSSLLLLFSTVPAAPGTIIEVANGPGALFDCSGGTRAVTFDINAGWNWGSYSWGQSVSAGSSLVPLLVEYSESLKASMATSKLATSAR